MKALIVTPYFYPKIGGVENYVLNISKRLSVDHHWDIVIVTTDDKVKRVTKEKKGNYVIYRLPVWFKISNTPINPLWYSKLQKIIQYEQPDIVNAHTPVPFLSDIGERARGKIKFILTYHNDIEKNNVLVKFLIYLYYLLIANQTLKRADTIIATSQYYVNKSPRLKKFKHKICIVPPGVNLQEFNCHNYDLRILKRYSKNKVVLFVGKLDKTHKHKGLSYLIDSMSKVAIDIPNIKLLVVGNGNNINEYQAQVNKLHLNKYVEIIQNVSNELLPSYYNASDVVILPSTNNSEGFGMVLIEAGACKKPVIGTKVGGIPFVIDQKKTGLLIPPMDIQSLSKSIKEILLNNKLSHKFGRNGYSKVIKHFDWHLQASNTNTIFKSVTSNAYNLVYVTSYYPPHLGGMEKVAKELYEKEKLKNSSTLLLTSNIGIPSQDHKSDMNVRYLRSIEIAHTPIIFSLLWNLLRIPKNSIIHLHVSQAYTPEIVYLVSKIRNIPFVAHIHLDVDPTGIFGFLLKPYKKYILSTVLRNANHIVCLSYSQRDSISTLYKIPINKISVVPNGVSKDYFNKKLIKNKSIFNVLFVGRISPQKNLTLLVNSFRYVNSNIHLRIVGNGEDGNKIYNLINSLGLSNISMLGRKSGVDLINEYKHADVFVLPSTKEGSPLVVFEAMASSLPIISLKNNGVDEIIKNVGFCVPDNHKILASTINKILSDKDLRTSLSKKAYKTAGNFTWENTISDLDKVYKEIL